MGMDIFRLCLGLAAVVGLMWFAYRKVSKLPGFGAGHLQVVERHHLTKNSVLVVLRDGDERVIIGASDQNVSELSRTAWVEPVAAPSKIDLPAAGSKFGEILRSASGRFNNK